jgi:hypothetical protein
VNSATIRVILIGLGGVVFMSAAEYFFRFRFGLHATAIVSLIIYYSLVGVLWIFKKRNSN